MGFELFADITGFKNPEVLFNGPRPDIVLKIGNELYAIELSCCYETNFVKTRNYKVERYDQLQNLCVDKNVKVTKLFVEVSSLGFLPKAIREFADFCKQFECINVTRLMYKISEVAIRASYFLYTKRNDKDWKNPEILKFY